MPFYYTQLAWICSQQRQNLSSLIIARPDTGPSVCCQRANKLENTRFVESYKAKGLKYEVFLPALQLQRHYTLLNLYVFRNFIFSM